MERFKRTMMIFIILFWLNGIIMLLMASSCKPVDRLTQEKYPEATEDEELRVEMLAGTYTLKDNISMKLTVIGKGVYFMGPCGMWFERRSRGEWEMVGECPEPPYDAEPFPNSTGEEIELSIPTTVENQYQYTYKLTTGMYRYAITYWAQDGPHQIYSPEFEIGE